MFKKIVMMMIAIAFLLPVSSTPTFAYPSYETRVFVGSDQIIYDEDFQPILDKESGYLIADLYQTAEAIGATAKAQGDVFTITKGNKKAFYEAKNADSKRVYIPVREVAIKFGYAVNFIKSQNAVYLLNNQPKTKMLKCGNSALSDSAWGKYLNSQGFAPLNQFKASYFDSRKPKIHVGAQIVDQPSLNHVHDDFLGIDAEHFGAYWAGCIQAEETEEREVVLDYSWAEARVYLDGKLIEMGEDDRGGAKVTLSKGIHYVEVEFLSNYFSAEFFFDLKSPVASHTYDEVKEILSKWMKEAPDAQLWYLSAYESTRQDRKIKVKLQASEKPVILFVSSYSPILWEIDNSDQVDVLGVIHNPFASAISFTQGQPDIALFPELSTEHQLAPYCYEEQPVVHCESYGIRSTNQQIIDLAGRRLNGVTVNYSGDAFTMPEVILSDYKYERMDIQFNELMNRIEAEHTENIDTIFENSDDSTKETRITLVDRYGIIYATWQDFKEGSARYESRGENPYFQIEFDSSVQLEKLSAELLGEAITLEINGYPAFEVFIKEVIKDGKIRFPIKYKEDAEALMKLING